MAILDWLVSPADREVTRNGLRFRISYSPSDNEDRACIDLLSIPAISAGIEVKANDVSQIPIYLYLRTDAGRQRVRNALDYRLSRQPNRYQNAATFWKTVAMQATVAECFVSTRGGELNLLPFGSTVRYTTAAGEVRYAVTYSAEELKGMGLDATAVVVKADYAYGEVWHLWTFQNEAGTPVPMRSRFKKVLGLAADVYAYTTNVYNRGGSIVGYLSTDQKVDADKKTGVIQAFKALFKSSRTNATGADQLMAALDNGWKFNKLDLTPQEMMLLDTKKDLKRDLAQIVNVPLWKIGELEDYKYATAEAAQREYLVSCLNPLLNQIESEINAKAIADFERPYFYVEFSRDALISIDAQTMATIDDLAVKNGTMSFDEYRARRNLPAVPGGSIRQLPVNVTSAEFLMESESLKLESLRADIALKQAQARAAGAPATAVNVTLPALPPAPAAPPADAPAEPATDFAAALRTAQARAAGMMPGLEAWKDPSAIAAMATAVCADVAALHGLEDLAGFAVRYAEATAKRLATAAAVSPAYEVNRAVNAANHEALKLAHGVKVRVRWVGGANDGKEQPVGTPWADGMRHPPLTAEECDCFLVPAR